MKSSYHRVCTLTFIYLKWTLHCDTFFKNDPSSFLRLRWAWKVVRHGGLSSCHRSTIDRSEPRRCRCSSIGNNLPNSTAVPGASLEIAQWNESAFALPFARTRKRRKRLFRVRPGSEGILSPDDVQPLELIAESGIDWNSIAGFVLSIQTAYVEAIDDESQSIINVNAAWMRISAENVTSSRIP